MPSSEPDAVYSSTNFPFDRCLRRARLAKANLPCCSRYVLCAP